MITVKEPYFLIETNNTSYLISFTESGLLLHHYYGKKVRFYDFDFIKEKINGGYGTSVLYEGSNDANKREEHVHAMNLEFSSVGVGDFREPIITTYKKDHGFYNNFKYQGYEKLSDAKLSTPHSYGEAEVLKIALTDSVLNLNVELYYKVFPTTDVISRFIRLINQSSQEIQIQRLFSMQLDLPASKYIMMTFDGTWAKERHLHERELFDGITINDSKTGTSSNKHNPLVILRKENTTEYQGECFGFNLVYSGNHKTTLEISETKKLRVLSGINDFAFHYTISPNEEFISPEAILTYSNSGLNLLSSNFHNFINNHIIRGTYKNKLRPVLINSWEATYFNFNEKKVLELARVAKKIGIELFVLDDGWFGKRNNDTSSLGDWEVNLKKLPHGISGLSKSIHELGLGFGLWVEPEMINEDSNLYREHPDWAVKINNQRPGISRNQLVLDLTNSNVREFLINKLTEIFSSCELNYVKWDYNRNITDMFGKTLLDQGEFFHRYILGLYEILDHLTSSFPNILFEGCASGGNRYDLGMLCYFPQIWTSDDTDYLERLYIQTGTSYGYPLSVMTNHVSGIPNHQTLRNTPLESRFELACFGNLGYELDLTELEDFELNKIKNQINFYKRNRCLFQYGSFYRSEKSIFKENSTYFSVISEEKDSGIVGFFQSLLHPGVEEDIIKVHGLLDGSYSFSNRKQKINIKRFGGLINMASPIKIKMNGKLHNFIARVYQPDCENESYKVYNDALEEAGVHLNQQFMGTAYNNKVRVLGDFGSRIYLIKLIKQNKSNKKN